MSDLIQFQTFQQVEMRAGTIIDAKPFPEARKPAYQLWVDFGVYGILQSSAQITQHYVIEDLIGTQIIGVINLEPRMIASFKSEFLVTGFEDEDGKIVLSRPEFTVPNGARLI